MIVSLTFIKKSYFTSNAKGGFTIYHNYLWALSKMTPVFINININDSENSSHEKANNASLTLGALKIPDCDPRPNK